jgi:Thi4 family
MRRRPRIAASPYDANPSIEGEGLPRTCPIRQTDEIVSHDVIVVGGGHNALTAAAYLARSGLDVCVLERRDVSAARA